ncbi:MAG: glycine oxidase ThiO [Chloroflexi bacterium]|nr:glycine oxidase ThiO [Chloroflexota bacterium]
MPDAVVIGGGVIGLLCARELRQRGLDVALVERDRPGRQASWASAGILSSPHPHDHTPASELKRRSQELFPSLVTALHDESGIDPERTWDGHLVPALTAEEAHELRVAAGTEDAAEYVEGASLREAEPAVGTGVVGALLRPGGQIDNRRLCRALEVANRRAGVDMRYGAAVSEVIREGDRVVGVRTVEGDVMAPIVVNAAGSWSGRVEGTAPTAPVAPQRGEILALDQSAIGLRRVITKVNDPYLVPRADGRLVIGATRRYVGYDSTYTAGGVAWLLNEALALVPRLAEAPVVEIWTGFRPNSLDGLPIIGKGEVEGLYFATGHGPSGIAPAPASAELLADVVEGATPKVPAAAFDPLRFRGIVAQVDPRGWGVRGGPRI